MSKIAIITGAGSGIGRSTGIAFLKHGYSVALAGRREDPLHETVSESGVDASNTLVVPTDVSDEDSVANLFSQTVEKFSRVDVVFNNAGIGAPKANLEDLPLDGWQQVVNINLTGVFLCTREAFRVMKDQDPQGGRIINNGSISAHVPRPNSAPYTGTKHGVAGLTKSASLDGRKYNIAVGQIDIGNAYTPMASRMSKGVPQANGSIEVEPTMDVENVAQAVLHMANLPPEANILFQTITATKMPFVGRG